MIERYQTAEMRAIWDDESRFARWTRIEIAACKVFHQRGEISDAEMHAIATRAHHQSAQRVSEIEKTTDHDVVAFVRAVGEMVGEPASRHLHRGLTSSDVVDTALAMAIGESLDALILSVMELKKHIAVRAREFKHQPCVGRTHGIHAEPTTFGLRLAGWYTECTRHLERLKNARINCSVGKLSGAVGTFSQTDPQFEAHVLSDVGLAVEPIATQVIPRDRHAEVFNTLALWGAGIERFATEIRHLQRTDVREVEEPFKKGQTGSSAMPHKRNPITSERLCGMARLLRGYAVAGLEDVALWHDRDISHSSVERIAFPDAFHLAHYMTLQMQRLIVGLRIYPQAMEENLHKTRGLIFSQNVLGLLLRKGLDRVHAYAAVQSAAMQVWEQTMADFRTALLADERVTQVVTEAELVEAFRLEPYFQHLDALFARAGIAE